MDQIDFDLLNMRWFNFVPCIWAKYERIINKNKFLYFKILKDQNGMDPIFGD